MTRSQIRYALARCKTGNQDKEQQDVLDSFSVTLSEFELDISTFNEKWDVSKDDVSKIVFGKTVERYNSLNRSAKS